MADYTIPDMGAAYAQGMSIGEAYRQRKRDDRTREGLGRYLSAGDRAGLDTAYQNDPDAAFKAQQAVQKQQGDAQTVAANFAKAWSAAPPQAKPNLISAARRTIAQRPDLQQVLGDQLPQTDDPTEWDNFLGQGALFGTQSSADDPAGYRQFQLQAEAAGLVPGSPEYKKAAQVALGLEGRASNAGFGQVKFTGADGRERIGVLNGRTGKIDLADGSTFNPQTGQTEQGQPPQQVNPEGSSAIVAAAANRMKAAGIPEAEIDAWAREQLGGQGEPVQLSQQDLAAPSPPQQSAPVQTPVARSSYADTPLDQVGGGSVGGPSPFVSRTPEEQAALTTAAQERAKNQAARDQAGFDVQFAADKAAATSTATARAEQTTKAQADLPLVEQTADDLVSLTDKALRHPGLKGSTGLASLNPLNKLPGSDQYDFTVLMDQIKGKAFLDSYNQLRGSGAITDKEGEAATKAKARLDAAQSPAEFKAALKELQNIAKLGKARARIKAGQRLPAAPAQRAPAANASRQALLDKY